MLKNNSAVVVVVKKVLASKPKSYFPIQHYGGRRQLSIGITKQQEQQQQHEEHIGQQQQKVPPYWKSNNGRFQRPIYIAATKQHVGKTTVSLAIISGLTKRFGKVGFIKPVGQQHVPVKTCGGEEVRVDKDSSLIREYFKLDHIDYEYISPVIIPRGYTKRYLDGNISQELQIATIMKSMTKIHKASDVTLIEGTGHCGVGSIVNLNNAKVASLLGADMILVANGGLGSAFDELQLNRVLCQHYGVRLAGVIINKVYPTKYDQTKTNMTKALKQMWGVPLLGCVPDRPYLGFAAVADLVRLFDGKLMCGHRHRLRHFNRLETNLVTTSLSTFLENLRSKPARTTYFCHATRNDIIVAFVGEYQRRKQKGEPFDALLIICGRKGKYTVSAEITDMLEDLDTPVISVELSTHEAMHKLHNFTPKLNYDDTARVEKAITHYEPHIDFDELIRRTSANNSSFNDPSSIQYEELLRL